MDQETGKQSLETLYPELAAYFLRHDLSADPRQQVAILQAFTESSSILLNAGVEESKLIVYKTTNGDDNPSLPQSRFNQDYERLSKFTKGSVPDSVIAYAALQRYPFHYINDYLTEVSKLLNDPNYNELPASVIQMAVFISADNPQLFLSKYIETTTRLGKDYRDSELADQLLRKLSA